MALLGISGRIASGKDTVGKIIQYLVWRDMVESGRISFSNYSLKDFDKLDFGYQMSGWKQVAFADKLKDIVCLLIGCTKEQLEEREFKEKELGEEWWKYELSWHEHAKVEGVYNTYEEACEELRNFGGSSFDEKDAITTIKLTPRLLMQFLGTEAGRQIIHPNIWCTSLFIEYKGDKEEWKDIKGYEGKYQISNFGRIKGLDRKIVYGDESKGKYHSKKDSVLKSTISGNYKMIKLQGNNSVTIHSLVANHFIPKIEDKPYINHIDQNPLNNFYKNLEWCTQSENILNANKSGNGNIGEKQYDAKLNNEQVLKIKELLTTNISQKKIAEMFNVGQTTITDIKKGRKWKHVGIKRTKINPILPIQLPNWIITDLRFPNEYEAVKQRGGITIRVNRYNSTCVCVDDSSLDCLTPCSRKPQHESEVALDHVTDWDYVIDNSGTIEELVEKVRTILVNEKII